MTAEEIQSAVNEFLDIIERGRGDETKSRAALEVALDKLALARHCLSYTFEADHPNPPGKNYQQVRALVTLRFPSLGMYNTALDVTTKLAETEIAVGDAIDDITDIARELYDVAWCWEHTSGNDAQWHYEDGYRGHWGGHLRNLQLYLHALQEEA
jgi:hypothetical protein